MKSRIRVPLSNITINLLRNVNTSFSERISLCVRQNEDHVENLIWYIVHGSYCCCFHWSCYSHLIFVFFVATIVVSPCLSDVTCIFYQNEISILLSKFMVQQQKLHNLNVFRRWWGCIKRNNLLNPIENYLTQPIRRYVTNPVPYCSTIRNEDDSYDVWRNAELSTASQPKNEF